MAREVKVKETNKKETKKKADSPVKELMKARKELESIVQDVIQGKEKNVKKVKAQKKEIARILTKMSLKEKQNG